MLLRKKGSQAIQSVTFLILYLEVTNNLSNGHFFTIPKRAPADWPGLCFFLFSYLFFFEMLPASWQVLALHFPGG